MPDIRITGETTDQVIRIYIDNETWVIKNGVLKPFNNFKGGSLRFRRAMVYKDLKHYFPAYARIVRRKPNVFWETVLYWLGGR